MHSNTSAPDTDRPSPEPGTERADAPSEPDASAGTSAGARADRQVSRPRGARLGRTSLVVAIVAAVGSIACAAIVGATVGPAQLALGPHLVDLPSGLFWSIVGLLGSQLFWFGLGLTAIVMGIAALVRGPRTAGAVSAIVVGVGFPFLTLFTLVLLMLSTTPL